MIKSRHFHRAVTAAAPALKPAKETLTKSALIKLIPEQNEIFRKTAAGVHATSRKPSVVG